MKSLFLFAALALALAVPAAQAQSSSKDTSAMLIHASWGDLKESVSCDHKLLSTTQPIVTYSNDRRSAHVSGVLLVQLSVGGPKLPSRDTTVNVLADVGHGFVSFQQVTTDSHGIYNATIEAPAPILSVTADSPSFVCVNDKKTTDARTVGAGGQ